MRKNWKVSLIGMVLLLLLMLCSCNTPKAETEKTKSVEILWNDGFITEYRDIETGGSLF